MEMHSLYTPRVEIKDRDSDDHLGAIYIRFTRGIRRGDDLFQFLSLHVRECLSIWQLPRACAMLKSWRKGGGVDSTQGVEYAA